MQLKHARRVERESREEEERGIRDQEQEGSEEQEQESDGLMPGDSVSNQGAEDRAAVEGTDDAKLKRLSTAERKVGGDHCPTADSSCVGRCRDVHASWSGGNQDKAQLCRGAPCYTVKEKEYKLVLDIYCSKIFTLPGIHISIT